MNNIYKSTFWSFFDYMVNKSGYIVINNIVLSRLLGPNAFGELAVGITISQSLWLISDLGLTQYSIKKVANDSNLKSNILILHSTKIILGVIVYLGLLVYLIINNKNILNDSTTYACLFVPIFAMTPDWYFKASFKFFSLSIINSISLLIYVFIIVATRIDEGDILLAAGIYGLSLSPAMILMNIILFKNIKSNKISNFIRFNKVTKILKSSIPFFIVSFLDNLLFSMPIYVITIFYSMEIVGIFSSHYRILIYGCSLMLPLSNVFFPILCQNKSIDSIIVSIKNYEKISQYISVIVFSILFMFHNEISLILLGKAYLGGAKYVQILSFLSFLIPIRLIFSNSMQALDLQNMLVKYSLTTLSISVVITVLVAYYGNIILVSITILFVESTYLMLLVKKIKNELKVKNLYSMSGYNTYLWVIVPVSILLKLVICNDPVILAIIAIFIFAILIYILNKRKMLFENGKKI